MLALLVPGVGMGAGTASTVTSIPPHSNTVLNGVVYQPTVEVTGGR